MLISLSHSTLRPNPPAPIPRMMYEKPYDHSENDYVLFNFERKSLTHSISKCNNDQKNAADAIFDAGTVTN